MNAAIRAYKTSENWMYSAYDSYTFRPFYRSLLMWVLTLLVVLTVGGGVDLLRKSWDILSDKARLLLAIAFTWPVLPWARAIQFQIRLRKSIPADGLVSEESRRLYRETVTSSLLAVLAVCAAVNVLLSVLSESLFRR